MFPQTESNPVGLSATATIPELQQSKTAVLNTLASKHSRRSYEYAIERFIAWYCSEPRLTFNRSVVVRYRSFLERLSLSAATINLHLSAIRRLADESAESGWLSPELAIGIRRVKGVKRLGRKMGNWLTRNQAQELVNAASKTNLRGLRDGAMVGLLLGCGLRRSEVVGLNLDQLQSREGRWVIVNLVGKGARLRTVPVPSWSKELVDAWLRHSGVTDGKVFRRLLGCGLRRSEAVNLRFDQLQLRESHWVIVDMVGKGGRLRTVPVPPWCKGLIHVWLRDSRVTEGKVFRRVSKDGARQDAGVTSDVVWYAVKQYAKRIGVDRLAPHDLRRTCARLCHGAGGELEQIQFLLGHASVQTTERYIGCRQNFREAVNDRFQISLANHAP
jgi:integrase